MYGLLHEQMQHMTRHSNAGSRRIPNILLHSNVSCASTTGYQHGLCEAHAEQSNLDKLIVRIMHLGKALLVSACKPYDFLAVHAVQSTFLPLPHSQHRPDSIYFTPIGGT